MRIVFGLLVLLPVMAAAETGYVTDRLMLGLHKAEDTSDRPFRSLESGTEFEILSRDRLYARVRLADGTEGYVKAAYVVYEPPAKLIVNQTQAEVERLTTELEEAKAAFAEPAAVIDSLKAETATLKSNLETARSRVEELEEEIRESQNDAFMEGRATHFFTEITAILEYIPEGFELDSDEEKPTSKSEDDALEKDLADVDAADDESEEALVADETMKWEDEEEEELFEND